MALIHINLDQKLLFSPYQYYLNVFLYVSAILSQWYGPQNTMFFVWLIYVVIPLLDTIFSLDYVNPTKDQIKEHGDKIKFRIPLYICVILDWVFVISSMHLVSTISLGAGHASASNINVAHELFHKDVPLEKFLGTLTLSKNLYMHFEIEHIHGHHKRVSTPEDPATSRQGETFYQFWPRSVVGSFKSAWNLEVKRLKEIKKVKSIWCVQNKMIWYTLNNVALPFLAYLLFGLAGMTLFIIQGVFSFTYLEATNYIEHYGLQRKEISPGVYEKVNITHSWNAPQRFSNYLLFKLQRHSDHHENGFKPYHVLCTYDMSPQLPHSYPVCILLSFFPRTWFAIMDEIVNEYKQKIIPSKETISKRNWRIFGVLCVIWTFFSILAFLEWYYFGRRK